MKNGHHRVLRHVLGCPRTHVSYHRPLDPQIPNRNGSLSPHSRPLGPQRGPCSSQWSHTLHRDCAVQAPRAPGPLRLPLPGRRGRVLAGRQAGGGFGGDELGNPTWQRARRSSQQWRLPGELQDATGRDTAAGRAGGGRATPPACALPPTCMPQHPVTTPASGGVYREMPARPSWPL